MARPTTSVMTWTARTSGFRSAACVSIETMCACACGEPSSAGHLGASIDPGHRLADDGETIVRRQRRRLAGRNLPLDFTDGDAGYSEWKFFLPHRLSRGHGSASAGLGRRERCRKDVWIGPASAQMAAGRRLYII